MFAASRMLYRRMPRAAQLVRNNRLLRTVQYGCSDDALGDKKEPFKLRLKKRQKNSQVDEQVEAPPKKTDGDAVATSSIHRELLNDLFQLTTKGLAAYFSNHGPFKAEFQRSLVDAVNHLTLYYAIKADTSPSKEYPMGKQKLKNFICTIPAVLFLVSGYFTAAESITFLYQAGEVGHGQTSMYSLLLYAVSIGIQLYVIGQNLKGGGLFTPKQSVDGILNQPQKYGLFDRMKIFFTNLSLIKSPPFLTIIYENMITLTSTFIPILCEILHYFLPNTTIMYPLGSLVISGIQFLVGITLLKQSLQMLVGDRRAEGVSEAIADILEKQKLVKSVTKTSAVMTGPETFRADSEIVIDSEPIMQLLNKKYGSRIYEIALIQDPLRRLTLLKQFYERMPAEILKIVEVELNRLEQLTKLRMEGCMDSDLDFSIEFNPKNQIVPLDKELSQQQVQEILKTENNPPPWIKDVLQSIIEKRKNPKSKEPNPHFSTFEQKQQNKV